MDKSRIALAVACAALLVALSGTGYAVVTLSRNSVKARHIAPRAVGSSEAHRLHASDFASGQLFRPKSGSTANPDPFFMTSENGCAARLATIPIKVTTRSKILAIGNAFFSHNQETSNTAGLVRVLLRNQADSQTLAVTQAGYAMSFQTFAEWITTAGVMHAGADSGTPSATPFVAQPGNYLLVLDAEQSTSTCGGGAFQSYFSGPELSYALLAP